MVIRDVANVDTPIRLRVGACEFGGSPTKLALRALMDAVTHTIKTANVVFSVPIRKSRRGDVDQRQSHGA